jgi:hypothetical protein
MGEHETGRGASGLVQLIRPFLRAAFARRRPAGMQSCGGIVVTARWQALERMFIGTHPVTRETRTSEDSRDPVARDSPAAGSQVVPCKAPSRPVKILWRPALGCTKCNTRPNQAHRSSSNRPGRVYCLLSRRNV